MKIRQHLVGIAASVAAFGFLFPVAAANPAGPHFVLKTYIASGDPQTALVTGANVVNNARVDCPKDEATCTLDLRAMDEVCSADNFKWEITVEVGWRR